MSTLLGRNTLVQKWHAQTEKTDAYENTKDRTTVLVRMIYSQKRDEVILGVVGALRFDVVLPRLLAIRQVSRSITRELNVSDVFEKNQRRG